MGTGGEGSGMGILLDRGVRREQRISKARPELSNGNHSPSFPLNDEGRFEIPKLLPGNYAIEVFVYGIGNASIEVALDDQDVSLDLKLTP